MSTKETSATAIVTMTVSIELSQPWSGDATLAQVQRQARDDATERMHSMIGELAKRGIRVGGIGSVRIVLNEEKLP